MATKTKRRKPSAFDKPVNVSPALAEVVGKGPMPRTKIVKQLWVYIKKNKCQDTENRRQINPDEKLAKVFGSKRSVDMFKMTSLVSKHIT